MHLILIALIFAMFFLAAMYRVNSRGVKQQVLEKQLALLIDAAEPETKITVQKLYLNGRINRLELREGRIFVYVDGQGFSKGYPYFSKHNVWLDYDENSYHIKVGERA